MTIRAEVLTLASLGPLPSESEGDVDDLAVRQSALQAIEPPVTVDEPRPSFHASGPTTALDSLESFFVRERSIERCAH